MALVPRGIRAAALGPGIGAWRKGFLRSVIKPAKVSDVGPVVPQNARRLGRIHSGRNIASTSPAQSAPGEPFCKSQPREDEQPRRRSRPADAISRSHPHPRFPAKEPASFLLIITA